MSQTDETSGIYLIFSGSPEHRVTAGKFNIIFYDRYRSGRNTKSFSIVFRIRTGTKIRERINSAES
ncbi:hypothetical protein DWW79_01775 [Alistipes sp. AF17-16]|nr:hypothetical protein DW082_02290 [Alistipes sp. AF48-12]RHR67695.1 hypothetical protein DWW79_01775 [Alistipes sp. AF17-16]